MEGFSRTRGLEGVLDALFLGLEEALRIVFFGDRDQRGDRTGRRNLGMDVIGGIMDGDGGPRKRYRIEQVDSLGPLSKNEASRNQIHRFRHSTFTNKSIPRR